MRTPTKILLVVVFVIVATGALWLFTSNVESPQDTRSYEERMKSSEDALDSRKPDLSDPKERAQFESTTDMIEGTESGGS